MMVPQLLKLRPTVLVLFPLSVLALLLSLVVLMYLSSSAGQAPALRWRLDRARTGAVTRVVVLLANKAQVDRALATAAQIRPPGPGNYSGDMVLIGGDDWRLESLAEPQRKQLTTLNISTHHYPDFNLSRLNETHAAHPFEHDGRAVTKQFQWHKIYLFDVWFRKWSAVLYIDAGCSISAPLEPFFTLDWRGALLAHSDAYPQYEWKLPSQFDVKARPDVTERMEQLCPYLHERDYFQSTLMLYDTATCINTSTVADLWDLAHAFPVSKTNEQGIMNLLFNCKVPIWRQIDLTYADEFNRRIALYDYIKRTKLTYTVWKIGRKRW